MTLHLRFHTTLLSVCQLESSAPAPLEILAQPFSAFLKVPGETTLICPTEVVPPHVKSEDGWQAMELVGPFDFALTGILTQIAVPLAAAGIAIYALSTFNTDYVLIKADKCELAKVALINAGHKFIE